MGTPPEWAIMRGAPHPHGYFQRFPLVVPLFLPASWQIIPADEFNERFAEWIQGQGVTSANNFYCAEG